jgi:hypothetical protein
VGKGSHAVRITTRAESGRAAIEATGAECLIGTPDRLATLRGALDGVTIVCWMLATARGEPEQVRALHGSRLESFMGQAIDTTMRGFVYETPNMGGSAVAGRGGNGYVRGVRADLGGGTSAPSGVAPAVALAESERIVRAVTSRNAIPLAIVRADPSDPDAWITAAREAIDSLLGA